MVEDSIPSEFENVVVEVLRSSPTPEPPQDTPWPRDPEAFPEEYEEQLDGYAVEALEAGDIERAIDIVGHINLLDEAASDRYNIANNHDLKRGLESLVAGDDLNAFFELSLEYEGHLRVCNSASGLNVRSRPSPTMVPCLPR